MSTTLKVFEACAEDLEKFSDQVNVMYMSQASQTSKFFLSTLSCVYASPAFHDCLRLQLGTFSSLIIKCTE